MTKYIGQANFATGLNVTIDQPLDDRTVVNTFEELYNIHNPYEGMTVAVLDTGVVYTLVNKANYGSEEGWKASGLAIEVLENEEEYSELVANGELRKDVFYFIKEVEEDTEKQGYVTGAQLVDLLGTKADKTTTNDLLDKYNVLLSKYQELENRITTLEPTEDSTEPSEGEII